MRTHIDLFSGIGGFALAAQWAGFRTIAFCENDPFCQKILKKHWPKVPIVSDIRDFNGQKFRGATLLTGGFPCQPVSTAGRRLGKNDDRWLWPEMLRIISENRPAWIIAENVVGIAYMVLAECEDALEALDYKTQSLDISACACGLPTMERHMWIIATSRGQQLEGCGKKCTSKQSPLELRKRIRRKDYYGSEGICRIPDLPEPRLCRSRKGISGHVDRHRAIGNAIPPQVAYEIMRLIP